MTKDEIGSVLKQLRIASGKTQREVAEMLGRTQQIIGHWETGYSQPDANTLFTLCAIYGTTVDDAFHLRKGRKNMPLPKEKYYTSEDYWNLPEGQRAELIDGQLYDMAPPNRIHQKLVIELAATIREYIKVNHGSCEIYPAPFAVNLYADDEKWVEPDISVICDRNKLTDRGCEGAPDFIIEVVSPSSRKMDYIIKNTLYSDAGVREYWIVDPSKERTTVYRYEEDAAPIIFHFSQTIHVGIFDSLDINVADLL